MIAVEAAPSGNDPSAERSAMSKMRKVINTPIAMIAHKRPCEIAVKMISIQAFEAFLADLFDVFVGFALAVLLACVLVFSLSSVDALVASFSMLLKSIPSVFAISSLATTLRALGYSAATLLTSSPLIIRTANLAV